VARYVERGGALLIAAGPPYPGAYILYNTPLGGVLPGGRRAKWWTASSRRN
jgi:hypothetical protein